ncbi:hypothetical protein Godav_029460, partial [Gossypium davidsonii]|nr:hypothetical protein [Gossypium davidsonii]
WNHSTSYVGIPTALEDIRLLLDQQSEAQFQWTPYEDLVIRAVILDEVFQNPNILHVKVPFVNYATIEMHQMDIEYIKIWENQYDHIPTREPIIIPELACVPDYIPWFRIHGKPYLLSEEQRRYKIRVERERRSPLKAGRRDDSTVPLTAPIQSPGLVPQPTRPTPQSL